MGRGSSKAGGTIKTYALFHGSPNADIEEFDIEKAGQNTSSGEKLLFFTDSKQMADDFSYERIESGSMAYDIKGKKGKVYEVDVTMSKPLDLTNLSSKDKSNLIKMSGGELNSDMVDRFSSGNNQLLKAFINLNSITDYGYDGLIAKMNSKGDKEYGVVSSNQVKIKKKKK